MKVPSFGRSASHLAFLPWNPFSLKVEEMDQTTTSFADDDQCREDTALGSAPARLSRQGWGSGYRRWLVLPWRFGGCAEPFGWRVGERRAAAAAAATAASAAGLVATSAASGCAGGGNGGLGHGALAGAGPLLGDCVLDTATRAAARERSRCLPGDASGGGRSGGEGAPGQRVSSARPRRRATLPVAAVARVTTGWPPAGGDGGGIGGGLGRRSQPPPAALR